jgi:hypothetical protein
MGMFRTRFGLLIAVACLATSANAFAQGCLRPTLDARAVQWSQLIVQAKFVSAADPGAMTTPSTNPSTQPSGQWQYQIFTFEITIILDQQTNVGAKVGDRIRVVHFFNEASSANSLCGDDFSGNQATGKPFILLLRHEADCTWSNDRHAQTDPRPDSLNSLNSYALVHLETLDDMGDSGVDQLKSDIADTRASEKDFDPDQAKSLTVALANAADATESEESEYQLLQMGYVAKDIVKDAVKTQTGPGVSRLKRVLRAITPPSLESVSASK